MFLKKNIFFKLDLKEATIGVMQFHTQITHVYRQF